VQGALLANPEKKGYILGKSWFMKNLIRIVLAASCLIFAASCAKYVEEKQKDLLISVITKGQWHVEEFLVGNQSVKEEFDGYNFQFQSDGSVLSAHGGATVKGSWSGDLSNYSIQSNFPSTSDPIVRLNGVWRITDSAVDYVQAEMSNGLVKNTLRLRKNS
jgi:hypothetical protein